MQQVRRVADKGGGNPTQRYFVISYAITRVMCLLLMADKILRKPGLAT
jgi:hypothetical protein